ncbi:MAG: Gfo/Idh/MocA family protein [Candidatus Brocadiia bacterium]
MSLRLPRRDFLRRVGLAAPALVGAQAAAAPAPSDRIALGIIGLGSMGLRHVKGFLQDTDCRIVAVCDVDAARRRLAANVVGKHYADRGPAQHRDFRRLLDSQHVDAVVIAVPDHWHAILGIRALRAGKDVYGEKPLALTIAEGRDMVREVRRTARVWQMGSWQRSTRRFRMACELVRNGRIGKLQRVEVGIGIGPTCPPQPPMPVPEGLDYEMWLGPAPWAPYTEKRCHWNFRWILDYSGGQVTDWGAHHVDIAHWGMGADGTGPVAVEGEGTFPDGLWDAATTYRFRCRYPSGAVMEVASNNFLTQGVRFIGEGGWVHVTRSRLAASSTDILRQRIGPHEIRLASPHEGHRQGHRRNFLHCVRTRQEPVTPIEVGHRSLIPAHLGNIAMRLGRRLRWDPEAERVLDDPEARRLLARPMREPWTY